MRRGSTLLAMVTLLVLGSVGLSVAGQTVVFTFDRTPSQGPPGTVIAFEGECYWEGKGNMPADRVIVSLFDPDGNFVKQVEATPGVNGEYNGTIKVPTDAELGDWTVEARCQIDQLEREETLEHPFTVVEADAEPAEIVREEPTFTG